MTDFTAPVDSPCVGVCTMNPEIGLCAGCYRTIEEIRQWWSMSNEQRAQVILQLEQRQMELADFD
ncbi:MAG TPA: DUF1289 domain-containing protein [Methylophilaceae bacterium]|nr:DUF1289 domain-containing protein [Methylophilaceae bacterium]